MTAGRTSGVIDRTPPGSFRKLRYALTEAGCAWVPETLERLDMIWARVRTGAVGEFQFDVESMPPEPPSPRTSTSPSLLRSPKGSAYVLRTSKDRSARRSFRR